jgi:hypothetical protein
MFAKGELVARRRLKRQLKAVASIAVALAAGTFLACQRGAEHLKEMVDAARGADKEAAVPDAGDATTTTGEAQVTAPIDGGPDGAEAASDTGAADAGPHDAAAQKRPTVDMKEHRKGMPVRDNLLE